jgi:hypothetical protein
MWDDVRPLRTSSHLMQLLTHYAEVADREAWQDRLMEMADLPPRELGRLHGELLAHGWIEQNTGSVPVLRVGAAPQCYRSTAAGRRALKNVLAEGKVEEDWEAA